MKRLVHLVAVMLLIGSTAMLAPTNAQAWWGGSPMGWMSRMMHGDGWGWDDYYYPYYGYYPYWGYPYYGYPYWGGYPYYGGWGYPYWGGYPYYGGWWGYPGGYLAQPQTCNTCSAPATSKAEK